jgi:hypothetical protein
LEKDKKAKEAAAKATVKVQPEENGRRRMMLGGMNGSVMMRKI